MNLTQGALARICAGEKVSHPNVQVLGFKRIAGAGTERYRVLLSDGESSNSFSMLATQLNPMIHDGELNQFTIIRLDKYICNQVQGQSKRVIIVLEVSVLQPGAQVGAKIGTPQAMGGDGHYYGSPMVQNQMANSNLGGAQAMGGWGSAIVQNQISNLGVARSSPVVQNQIANLGVAQAGPMVQNQISNLGGAQASPVVQNQISNLGVAQAGPVVQNQISNLGGAQASPVVQNQISNLGVAQAGPVVQNQISNLGGSQANPVVQNQIANLGDAQAIPVIQNQIVNPNMGVGAKRMNDQQLQTHHTYKFKKIMVNDQPRTSVLNQSVEDIRTNVRNQYMEQINQTYLEIQEIENKIRDNVILSDQKKRDLMKKHDVEKESLTKETKILDEEKSLLEKSLADIQQKMADIKQKLADKNKSLDNIRKSREEMEAKHANEKAILEAKLKKENDEAPQNLANLKMMTNQLSKDLKKLDSDTDNDAAAKESLEAAKGTLDSLERSLECPVCLETMRPPVKIWMCPASHLACEPCKNTLSRRSCPTCRTGKVNLRAFMAENFARNLFKN